MTKVIDIWKWRRPRKLDEPHCAIPMRVKLRNGWGYWDLRGGCFRRLTEDVNMLVDWIGENEQEELALVHILQRINFLTELEIGCLGFCTSPTDHSPLSLLDGRGHLAAEYANRDCSQAAPLLELAERAERLSLDSVWAGAPAKSPTSKRH